jgi:hypothetical protein
MAALKQTHGSNSFPGDLYTEDNELQAALGQVPCVDVVQKPGETLVVPSGWYHQVCCPEAAQLYFRYCAPVSRATCKCILGAQSNDGHLRQSQLGQRV